MNGCISERNRRARGMLLVASSACLLGSINAQNTTWQGATNGEWGTAGNWTNGVPNATGAIANINSALTVNVSDTGTGGTYPYTFGTLFTNITSNSVVVGNNAVTTDILTAAVASGTPIVDVANSGGTIFYYANLQGTQGFQKNGAGKFTFRFNGADQSYTGNILINGGVLGINQDRSLGDVNNDITIANGARLLAEPGSNTGVITLPSTRTFTLSGAQSQIGSGNAAVTLVINGTIGESSAGQGLVKTDAGKVTLAGLISYTGETRIAGGTLAMSGSALLPSGQNLRFNQAAACGLDLGGTSQTVRTIVMDNTAANRAFTGGGSLTVNGDANLQLNANNGVTYDFSGINSFTFNKSTRQFNVQVVNAASTTTITDLYLAKSGGTGGTNTVTASQILIGGGNSDGNNGNTAKLHLGTVNDFRTPLFQVGGFNAGGIVDFQSGLTNPSLKIRGTDGSSAAATWKIGETSSGTRRGEGVVDLTNGSLDALVTDLVVGRHVAGANLADTSSLNMPAGVLTATSILLAEKTGTGTPTLAATLTQGGGSVKVDTLTMGKDAGGGATPFLKPTYNLNGGTLFAKAIDGGSGAFDSTSARNLSLNGGTLRNYDSSSDLTVDGVDSTAGGRLNVVLGAPGGKFYADSGRFITITPFAPLSGVGGLIKQGGGTLTLKGSNTYSGTYSSIDEGTLAGESNTAFSGTTVYVGNGTTLGTAATLLLSTPTGGTSVSNQVEINPGNGSSRTVGGSNTSGTNTFTGLIKMDGSFGENRSMRVTAAGGGTVAFSNTISGAGQSVAKVGAGTVIFGGNNTYSGSTSVSEGLLLVNGTHTGGDNYTVNSTGKLGGTGVITLAASKSLTVNSGGVLAPGASIGTLTVNASSFNLASSSTFAVEVDNLTSPGTVTNADQVIVGSSASTITVSGSGLRFDFLSPASGAVTQSTPLVILRNNSSNAVTGSFAGMPRSGGVADKFEKLTGVLQFKLYYSFDAASNSYTGGNDIAIEFSAVPEPGTFGLLGMGSLAVLRRRVRAK